MTEPDRAHPQEPAEGAEQPGTVGNARTPHPEEPAEGQETAAGGGADTPDV